MRVQHFMEEEKSVAKGVGSRHGDDLSDRNGLNVSVKFSVSFHVAQVKYQDSVQ